jgi:hypothetical protein
VLALVTAHVWLITIITESLAAPLSHLCRRKATERPRRLLWRRSECRGLCRSDQSHPL